MRRESWIAIAFTLVLATGGAGWFAFNAPSYADPGPAHNSPGGSGLLQQRLLAPPRPYVPTSDAELGATYQARSLWWSLAG